MAISFDNYIDITSGVSGTGQIRARELITRVFSENPLIPANSFAEFTNADDVGTYFGTTSTEYARAAYYFGFLSKQNTQPQKISFASYVNAARAPTAYSDPAQVASLATLAAIANGKLDLTLGATTGNITGINLTTATSLASVATLLQAAIRGASVAGGDAQWLTATVTYNAVGPNGAYFELVGGVAGPGAIAFTDETSGTDLAAALGWESVNAILSQGSAIMTLTQTMISSVAASNNFGSFCFDIAGGLNEAQILELATWLATVNVEYIGLFGVTASNAEAVSAAIISLPGNAMTLTVAGNPDFPEMIPGMILASTDYDQPNASQNYMYQQVPGSVATVADDTDQKTYDALRVNYYGQTQQAGQQISFYQRGILTGLASSPSDMNVFANEIWLKSTMGDAFMNVLLAETEIPANASGKATVLSIIDSVVTEALPNGVISVAVQPGLTQSQIAAITSSSGSPTAWRQVAAIGYWRTMNFSSYVTVDEHTEYQANYTLIYTKNNAIRKVVGTHNLI